METIYTLDARDNFLLELVKEQFKLSSDDLYREVRNLFAECVAILQKKKIEYQDLKNALIPHKDRSEIALVFDSAKIESSWYGYEVFSKIIPLFNKESSHSILCGDYIGKNDLREKLYDEFMENLIPIKSINYIDYYHHGQFFLVYINNLSEKMVKDFHDGLKEFLPYVGYFDITFNSFIKTYFSSILVKSFIKNKKTIILGHEDDVSNDENRNMNGYPYEENGYTYKSIQSMYYDLFLSYKIERRVFTGFEIDTELSINAINPTVLDIKEFKVLIDEIKFADYLQKEKSGSLKRAGIISFSKEELENFIRDKVDTNYIFNLCYLDEFGTTKFNVIIEAITEDTNQPIRLIASLEYKPLDKILRLITLF